MAFAPVFAVVAVVMAVRRIREYGMVRPGREMLNSVLSPEEKYKAKSFIDTVLYRGGDAVSAWLKSSFNVLGAHSPWAMLAGRHFLSLGGHRIPACGQVPENGRSTGKK
ncbi:MAG: hypothetical protein ACLT38_00720 [Akkermansia sp.]